MILQNENLQGAEGMKRISVRIIQSLSDYPGNMELCQVEEVCNCGCAVSVYYSWDGGGGGGGCARAHKTPVRSVHVASLNSSGVFAH